MFQFYIKRVNRYLKRVALLVVEIKSFGNYRGSIRFWTKEEPELSEQFIGNDGADELDYLPRDGLETVWHGPDGVFEHQPFGKGVICLMDKESILLIGYMEKKYLAECEDQENGM